MKILVTGGCGFIGSNFIEYVLENTDYEIINIDALTYAGLSQFPPSERYTFYRTNIGDQTVNNILHHHKPEYIVNFAAETHVDRSIANPFNFIQTNIVNTFHFLMNVLNYSKEQSVRVLHISTDEVYGQLKLDDPAFTEGTQYAPNSPYSATKASSDHLVRSMVHTYGLPAIITNCSNNYGPRQHPEKFIPTVIWNAMNDTEIPIYGSGMNIRDWLFVKDHCEALLAVLTNGTIGERYNIGGDNEQNNLYTATTILQLMDKPLSLIKYVEDRKGHDFRYAIDSSHLKNILGWKPKTEFIDGLGQTIDWYFNNLQWLRQCKKL